jgi:hypothetical protein
VKTVAEKLLIKPGASLWVSDGSRLDLVGALPDGARPVKGLDSADTAVIFADDSGSLRAILSAEGEALGRPSALWVAYPKGNRADINRDTLWPILGEHALRPITQVSIDDVWSALRFRPLQEGEAPFSPRAPRGDSGPAPRGSPG